MKKALTQEQKDKATNARLLRTYGITLLEREQMLKRQGHVCKICGSDGGSRALHIDHCHKYKYVKIDCLKRDGFWVASAWYRGDLYSTGHDNKNTAIQTIRFALKKDSIRGAICWPCNRTLRSGFDDPDRFAAMAGYLQDFNAS